jgi:hypothetical protein
MESNLKEKSGICHKNFPVSSTLISFGCITKALGGFMNIMGLVGTALRKRSIN